MVSVRFSFKFCDKLAYWFAYGFQYSPVNRWIRLINILLLHYQFIPLCFKLTKLDKGKILVAIQSSI